MEIRLSPAQYQLLIKLVYLGQWMIEGAREEEGDLEEYDSLASYIYSYAPLFGAKNLVDFDEAEGEYYPSSELDELMEEIVARYEESSFWDQLVIRLAERDLVREYGEEGIKRMDWKELEDKRGALIKKYLREIEEHGLDNLVIERIS
jgi:hypothetical protein